MIKKYEHRNIEKDIQKKWAENKIYEINLDDNSKEKFYLLDMWPYPSGDGLHMGHVESYSITDTFYRYKKMKGFNVLHPQGFDGFGLPAENFAIKTGTHPAKTTEGNSDNYLRQWGDLGMGHDFSKLVYSNKPETYRWTQFLFGKFLENDLVYKKTAKANWCSSCNTIIANEQIEGGACERCKTEIEQKDIPSWMFRITDFSDELIDGLDDLDWPEHTKKNQKAWIGKSQGAKIKFDVVFKNDNFVKKKVIMVHGCPSRDKGIVDETYHKHWQPWLKKELENKNIFVEFPLMPHPWEPIYEEHKVEFEKLDINENSILIGHSCGANFLIRWLSENNQKIDKLILVAPWNEPDHESKINAEFYNLESINYSFKESIKDVIIFVADNEEEIGKRTAKFWEEKLNAKKIELKDHGHFTEGDMGKVEFPELLNEVLGKKQIEVFTTRPDTLFGATYMVLAPEHNLVQGWKDKIENLEEVEKYISDTKKKTELDRLEGKEKTGVELKGVKAINPANQEELPIFISDYVLAGYGTGAIMAVPAHDERDNEFAKKFGINYKRVIDEKFTTGVFLEDADIVRSIKKKLYDDKGSEEFYVDFPNDIDEGLKEKILNIDGYKEKVGFDNIELINFRISKSALNLRLLTFYYRGFILVGNGILVNSGEFDGMDSEEAKEKITEFVGGEVTSTYRLRDWSISRQRYWGTPIPVVYSPEGEAKFVGEENLPWKLPTDVDFIPTGEAPLVKSKELFERTEALFGKGWTPEVDTMDTFVDSSWYFLRYPDSENSEEFASGERLEKWMPVDLYIGGAEHTYMHLLYARFFTRAMEKMGLVDFKEPFLKLRHQGMVNDIHGKKMSKSKGNVVNPDEMVERFGADATRAYMLFAGPVEDDVQWNEDNIVGIYRWIEKIWRQQDKLVDGENLDFKKQLHKTIKSVGEHMEALKFNVAISDMMKLMNFADKEKEINKSDFLEFIKIASVFIPHVAENIFTELGGEGFLVEKDWPKFNKELIIDDLIIMAVQVNGKKRGDIQISPTASENEVVEISKANNEIAKWLEGDIKKVVYIPGRILNFVVK